MTSADVLKLIKKENVVFVDLRFTDTKGKEQHVTVPTAEVDKTFLKEGKMFDGSSIAGWKFINESDMILMPNTSSSTSAATSSNLWTARATNGAPGHALSVRLLI